MKLQVNLSIESDFIFEIRFQNNLQKMYSGRENIIFTFDSPGEYELEISQRPTRKHLNFFLFLLCIPASFVQFIFWGFTVSSKVKWEKNLRPYCLTTSLRLHLEDDMILNLYYSGGKYNDKTGLIEKPSIEITDAASMIQRRDTITLNRYDFGRRLFHYLRVITALFITIFVFFSILGISGIQRNHIGFIIISLIAIVVLIPAYIKILIKNLRKKKKLLNQFQLSMKGNC